MRFARRTYRGAGWYVVCNNRARSGVADHGCLTVVGKTLPYGRGSITGALISQDLPSRDRQTSELIRQ
jgi:hypothetical protein